MAVHQDTQHHANPHHDDQLQDVAPGRRGRSVHSVCQRAGGGGGGRQAGVRGNWGLEGLEIWALENCFISPSFVYVMMGSQAKYCLTITPEETAALKPVSCYLLAVSC